MGRYFSAWNNSLTFFGLNCTEEMKDSTEVNPRYGISKKKMMFPLTIILTLAFFTYESAKQFRFELDNLGVTVVSGYLEFSGNVVTAITIIFSLVNTGKYARLKSAFRAFDLSVFLEHNSIRRSITKYTACLVSVYTISFATDLVEVHANESSIWQIVSYFIFQLYNLLSICQFAICLFWLRTCFNLLSRDLMAASKFMFRSKKQDAFEEFIYQGLDDSKHIPHIIDFRRTRLTQGGTTVDRLRRLRNLYHAAYLLTQHTNELFATRNLLTVGHNFVLGTIYMYSVIRGIPATNGRASLFIEVLSNMKWSLICFLSIYGLVWPSTSTSNEAKKITLIVHEALTKQMPEDLRAEIVGAVVSYLVVLIQFRITVM